MGASKETEQRLLDCALTLFSQKGYAATSIREIIEAAGVTRPVLYYYFTNKEALFARLIEVTHTGAYQKLGATLTQDSSCETRLRLLIRGSFAFCVRDPRLPRLLFQVTYGPPLEEVSKVVDALVALRFGLVVSIVQEGISSGELQGGTAESLALAFCCLMDQHINSLCSLPHPESRLTPELADGLLALFLHGAGIGERQRIALPAIPLR